jgi:cytochrome c-type biogenesis protein
LFIAGFTVVFVAVTILGGTFGYLLLQYANVLTRVFGVVIIALGLVFLGFFGIAQRTLRPRAQGRTGLIGRRFSGSRSASAGPLYRPDARSDHLYVVEPR